MFFRNECFINFAWPNITLCINLMSTEKQDKTITYFKISLYCF